MKNLQIHSNDRLNLTSRYIILHTQTLSLCARHKGICWSAGTAPPILIPLKGKLDGLQSRSWRTGEESWRLCRFLCCLCNL